MVKQIEVPPFDEHNQTLVANAHPPHWENPVADERYNLLVVGGGSAGLVAAVGGNGVGAKVALVEKGLLGGDCLNVGCVPSKTLIRSARAVGEIRRAASVGVHVDGRICVDFAAVMERVRRVRAEISFHDSAERFRNLGIDLYLGEGRFTGPHTFAVDGRIIHFQKAVIATGARPKQIPIPGLAEAGYLTNTSLFELTELPPRLAVIGAGPVGVEMAQAFHRLGSEVCLFDMLPTLASLDDADGIALLRRVFTEEGIGIFLESDIRRVEMVDGQKAVIFEHEGAEKQEPVDEILLAAGRRPNVEGLNLQAAGVAHDEQGLIVNDRLQTDNPDIYGAGDVAIPHQFTHTADATARMVLQNALFLGRKRYSDLVIPWTVYTDPEVAHVGLSPAAAEEQELAVDTYKIDIRETDRGRTDGDEGFVKIYTRAGSDEIVGATIIAPHAGEMIGEITTAMVAGAGLDTLKDVIHPYPTEAEAIRKAADAWNRTRLTPVVEKAFDLWLSLRR